MGGFFVASLIIGAQRHKVTKWHKDIFNLLHSRYFHKTSFVIPSRHSVFVV